MKTKLDRLLKNIVNSFRFFIIIIITFSFIFVSLSTAYTSHLSFYNKKGIPFVNKVLERINTYETFDLFLTYTGLNTGYGFFSPNVKSDIIIINEFYKDRKKRIFSSDSFLSTKEGKIRYRGVNDIFMDKMTIEEEIEKGKYENMEKKIAEYLVRNDSLKLQYIKIVLKQMNRHYLKSEKYDSITSTAYLYHFPFLSEYPNVKPKLFKIESITILSQ